MGWTFLEFDDQPLDQVMTYWHLRGLAAEIVQSRARSAGGDE